MARMLTGVLLGVGMILLLLGTTGRNANAVTQDLKPAEVKSTRIALIDMAKVFKNSRTFEKKRDDLKVKVGEAEEAAKAIQVTLLKMKKELDQMEKGAEDRASLEARMKSKMAEFEKFRQEHQRKLLKEEAEIYVEVYESVTSEVAGYAREHGIDLVIRTNSEPLEKDDPAKLLSGMNRQVVFENGLDITEEIIAAMK